MEIRTAKNTENYFVIKSELIQKHNSKLGSHKFFQKNVKFTSDLTELPNTKEILKIEKKSKWFKMTCGAVESPEPISETRRFFWRNYCIGDLNG